MKKLTAVMLSAGMMLGMIGHATAAEKKIIINSASRELALYDGNSKIRVFPLGLGKPSTPTPYGYYKIYTKEIDPPWIDPSNPEYEIPSGENNPLGYRWMQIKGNYGIHGTNRPDSIGYYVSNGCIRMREADVETLFDMVEVGTPVEITYNRIVVEKMPDDNIAYSIFPDGYGWQPVDVELVTRWLEPYGVASFESDEDIWQKIENSDGEPTYIGKAYPIEINGRRLEPYEKDGRKFDSKAVMRAGITYLPAVPIAMAARMKIEWRAGEATLKTAYGKAVGFEQKRQIYFNADDAIVLFHLDGGLQNKVYSLDTSAQPMIEPDKKSEPKPEKKSDKKSDKKTDQKKSVEEKTAPVDEKPSVEEKTAPVDEKPSVEEKTAPVNEKQSAIDKQSVRDKNFEDPNVDKTADKH